MKDLNSYIERQGKFYSGSIDYRIRLGRKRKRFAEKLNERRPWSEEWLKPYLMEAGLLERGRDKGLCPASHRWCQNFVFDAYIIDFAFRNLKVAIEVDESSHRGREAQDKVRQGILENRGWVVYRIWAPTSREKVFELLREIKKLAYTSMYLRRKFKRKNVKGRDLLMEMRRTDWTLHGEHSEFWDIKC